MDNITQQPNAAIKRPRSLRAAGAGNRVAEDGDGPLGPTRMLLDKPVIAAVEGHAVAGGLELALWCDLRVVAEDAVFGVFCRRWGVPLIDGGTVRLARGGDLDWVYPGGNFQENFRVYGRSGLPCPRCATPIAHIRVAQRSTHFCPACQH